MPVEKVVIQEVPKEIVRKELVYVPLYSVESGTIDTTKGSKEIKPEFLKEAEVKDQTAKSTETPNKKTSKKKT